MYNLQTIGAGYLRREIEKFVDEIDHITPVQFNEEHRYLPDSVTPMPGFISFDVNPFAREIVNCFDVDSPIREVNILKATQVTYTTILESVMMYYMFCVKTKPIMFLTADKDMASARIENMVIPMIDQSGFSDMIRSSDSTSNRKTGRTAKQIQFDGGGFLLWFGGNNPAKFRSWPVPILLKDEIDTWVHEIKGQCPDITTDERAASFPHSKKILRGSTPLEKDTSKIYRAFLKGDQRKYHVRCISCGYSQVLMWTGVNKATGLEFGIDWETENGQLIPGSACYRCRDCGHRHYEHDKEKLLSENYGAEWKPTARPVSPMIRSYHIPALMSPLGMRTWADCVSSWLNAWDTEKNKVRDVIALQSFYNDVLGWPFEEQGSKIKFEAVSAHRRSAYKFGEIPNKYAEQWSDSKILCLTCTVDVHKSNLAVAVWGWTIDRRCYLIDYWRFEDDSKEGCTELSSPAWKRLKKLILEKIYVADDGRQYGIAVTLIDSGYINATVCEFCEEFDEGWGVYPIVGRQRAARNAQIKEFQYFKTQIGTTGIKIIVDHYKDKLAPVMRREWMEAEGVQDKNHFNAPIDVSKEQLEELTREHRTKATDDKGHVYYFWKQKPQNELWDLLIYGFASIDVLANNLCITENEMDAVDWPSFWAYLAGSPDTPAPFFVEG
jgi:phage terminase large subunit GpA-like protein